MAVEWLTSDSSTAGSIDRFVGQGLRSLARANPEEKDGS
jgi:hypothetical protein